MEALRLAHLLLIFVWGGVILAETVVEALGRDPAAQPFAARAHFWIDVVIELPIVAGVLATGVLLAAAAWPLSTVQWVKVGAAAVAIGANLYCAALVAMRYRRRADGAALGRISGHIRLTWTAVPVGLVALYLGLR